MCCPRSLTTASKRGTGTTVDNASCIGWYDSMKLTAKERLLFHVKVDKSAGARACWPWTASCNQKGYGIFTVRRNGHATGGGAHRFAWREAHNKAVPAGLCVLHRCDNPPCCNPRHLFLGTHADNGRDKAQKGRAFRHVGKLNGRAKLGPAIVRAIRADRRSQDVIAQVYGVHQTTISRVKRGDTWKD